MPEKVVLEGVKAGGQRRAGTEAWRQQGLND